MPSTFADNPAEYFKFQPAKAHGMSRAEREPLQLDALQARFAAMRDAITPLKALADGQGEDNITSLDDVPALMFPHSFYKSYPEQLITDRDFPALTNWLSRLTLHDVSPVMDSQFDTIDGWLTTLEQHTELSMLHSSGTMGRLSFTPRGKHEHTMFKQHAQMAMVDMMAPARFDRSNPDFAIIWPSYADGWSAVGRAGPTFAEAYCQSLDDFHPLIPMQMSADYQHYLTQAEEAQRTGRFLSPQPSDYVRPMIDQSLQLQQSHDQRVNAMLDLIQTSLRHQKIFLAGGPVMLYMLAKAGLERGMENALASGSIIAAFGGFKGTTPAGDEAETLTRFTGISKFWQFYGMTELSSGIWACDQGRFHIHPWIIPYVLDPLTGLPKPREGVQEGRGAFMDLAAKSYWGGVISADHVEISWNPCSCGRTTPHIEDDIKRVTDEETREHYIGPAPEAAIDAALAALNEGLEQESGLQC